MSSETFADAVFDTEPGEPRLVEAGRMEQIDVAIIRDMIHDWKEIPSDVKALLNVTDLYLRWYDILPALYQFLSYSHVMAYRHMLDTGSTSGPI